ncbi:multidrug ABC transporter ATP-binding protein [Kitasatospora sp. MMS16-BH015]|uniref:ABC transporter ATP-binding protein n=1 Tax=Kitasatospora sp. MMS16-BH015 TaxID=2018025 RepID=UPI000CA11B29|nr:ABC transporter ATP-binding protein [Kitasatospora sp. MMS16-BH015]AUG81142.1 multidrug ABC transporter ATP-binding protein [Kitasatospora sp. MMS16-BH015]
MTAAVRVEGLVKSYPEMTRNAVDGMSFELAAGEVVGLLGPNGAGKTTLTKLLCGVTTPTAGRVTVFGAEPVNGSGAKREIGVMHQAGPFDMMLTVEDNLRIAAAFKDLGWREVRSTVKELLDLLGLGGSAGQLVFTLSGGERRRLQIIRALLGRPRLLLLDEPSAGMDVGGRRQLWGLLRELRGRHGTTVLWTSHYVEELERNCGRVLIVDRGRILAQGGPRELAERYGSPVALVQPAEPAGVEPLVEQSRRAGLRAVVAGGLVELTGAGVRDRLPALLDRHRAEGRAVTSVDFRAPSLEDAFVDLVERRRDH